MLSLAALRVIQPKNSEKKSFCRKGTKSAKDFVVEVLFGPAAFRVGLISSNSQRKKSNKRRGDAEIGGREDTCWNE